MNIKELRRQRAAVDADIANISAQIAELDTRQRVLRKELDGQMKEQRKLTSQIKKLEREEL